MVSATNGLLSVDLLSGHPLLADAAIAAVKQWVYKPTLLNGEPVEVATVVDQHRGQAPLGVGDAPVVADRRELIEALRQ